MQFLSDLKYVFGNGIAEQDRLEKTRNSNKCTVWDHRYTSKDTFLLQSRWCGKYNTEESFLRPLGARKPLVMNIVEHIHWFHIGSEVEGYAVMCWYLSLLSGL